VVKSRTIAAGSRGRGNRRREDTISSIHKSYKNYGLDLMKGKVVDEIKAGVLETIVSMVRQLKGAVEAPTDHSFSRQLRPDSHLPTTTCSTLSNTSELVEGPLSISTPSPSRFSTRPSTCHAWLIKLLYDSGRQLDRLRDHGVRDVITIGGLPKANRSTVLPRALPKDRERLPESPGAESNKTVGELGGFGSHGAPPH
jgi:hypothetical protein